MKYVINRLLQLIPVLLGITFLSFAMMRLAGSDVVEQKMLNTGQVVSDAQLELAKEELGLNQPFYIQYFRWLENLMQGDMGVSYVSGKDVFETFTSKLPATIMLTLTSIVLTVLKV